MSEPVDVPIRDDSIRLGQFLKLANLVDSGADAKAAVVAGQVFVNGVVDKRRGWLLQHGDVVAVGGVSARVVSRA
jgi:ribosome-associated protein